MIRQRFLYALALLGLAMASCQVTEDSAVQDMYSPVQVGFEAGPLQTRSYVGEDGRSVNWSAGDRIAVWAKNSSGSWQLSAEPFFVYAVDGSRAWFSTTLSSAMPEDAYTYYACSPVPASSDGISAVFSLPTVQDGLAGDGADIMIASPVAFGALSGLPDPEDHSSMTMSFSHLVHLLRFYVPEGGDMFGGEPVQRIVVTMPRDVVGNVSCDLSDASFASLSSGSSVIDLRLANPIGESGSTRDYAYASIFPSTFASGEKMSVKMYSETKVGYVEPIDMKSRIMAAGHATSVCLVPNSVSTFCKIYFDIASNNLGEDVQKITLTAPSGCKWSDTGSETYVLEPGVDMGTGFSFTLEYEDEASYRTLSGAAVTVTYDSEHVTISESLTMPDMTSGYNCRIALNVPYLYFEDFSTLEGFHSDDNYYTSSAGNKSGTTFFNGWSGGRVGGESGCCIRLACRRETSVDYHSRADSAPFAGILKKAADVSVTFDYGADNEYGGIAILTWDGNVGQNAYIGYVTDTKTFGSAATDGTFEDEHTFYVKEYTGSWTSTPNDYSMTIHSMSAGDTHRLTWRTEVEHQAGTTNTTAWLYIDNIRVQIAHSDE